MTRGLGPYHFAVRGDDVVIYQENEVQGSYSKIATIANKPDKFVIARNMVLALNSRHKYLQKIKNEK